MSSTILVPLDGSATAEQAIPYAQRLAGALRGHVLLVQVAEPVVFTGTEISAQHPNAVAEARDYLDGLAQLMSSWSQRVETCVTTGGDVAGAILDQAGTTDSHLIVMSTHGRSGFGRGLFGSVADDVLRRASVPVMLVPPNCAPSWPESGASRILVPLDGSPFAEQALEPATALAVLLNANIVLLRVVPWPPAVAAASGVDTALPRQREQQIAEAQAYLVDVARPVEKSIPVVRIRAAAGAPALVIADAAQEERADFIAMATHGRTGLARVVMGSVATSTLRHARVPVLFVRPHTHA
jgi:nucleotide-binding universal stress UspA family protein